jgi:hypothetical protein
MAAPCNWTIDPACCQAFWDSLDPAEQARAAAWASKVLWALTGRQFGDCPIVVRPCVQRVAQTYRTYGVWTDGYYDGSTGPSWVPYIDSAGAWRNCGCSSMCSCVPSSQVWLPGPVTSIAEVRVNGVLVPAGDYRVDIAEGLYWLVGENGRVWPDCQNFDNPAAGADTFSVTYTRAALLPDEGAAMAGMMACDFAKACRGLECALSKAAVSISRDGVSYEIATADDLISKGFTQLPAVNMWINAVNPGGLRGRGRVFSFDQDPDRYTVIS